MRAHAQIARWGPRLHELCAGLLHELHLALVGVERGELADAGLVRAVDLVRKHVEECLGVGGRAEHAVEERGGRLELVAQLRRVGEVAVVDEEDAEGRVDVEGLRLLC